MEVTCFTMKEHFLRLLYLHVFSFTFNRVECLGYRNIEGSSNVLGVLPENKYVHKNYRSFNESLLTNFYKYLTYLTSFPLCDIPTTLPDPDLKSTIKPLRHGTKSFIPGT